MFSVPQCAPFEHTAYPPPPPLGGGAYHQLGNTVLTLSAQIRFGYTGYTTTLFKLQRLHIGELYGKAFMNAAAKPIIWKGNDLNAF
jgi:hypothetical protein